MEVGADGCAAAVKEVAVFDGAVFGSTEAEEGVGFVVELPVVLEAFVILGHTVGVATGEGEAAETEITNWLVGWPFNVVLAFDEEVFLKAGDPYVFWRTLGSWPKVDFFLFGIDDPFARLIEGVDGIFDPSGFRFWEEMKAIHSIGRGDGSGGNLFFCID